MSEKRVKAWAVVNKRGKLVEEYMRLWVLRTKADALRVAFAKQGERVVRVTIIVEEK